MKKNDGDHFGAYLHNGGQIASLVTLEGADDEAAHDVAMHVSAVNPQYVSREDVPAETLDHEREVLTEETKNEGKPENIIPKIVEGRVNKFLSEISLNDQAFIKDSDQTVAQFVASKNGSVKGFVRFTVGEGIEKKKKITLLMKSWAKSNKLILLQKGNAICAPFFCSFTIIQNRIPK